MAPITQPSSSLPSLNPQRMQYLKTFLASDEPVQIIPSFHYNSRMDFLLTLASSSSSPNSTRPNSDSDPSIGVGPLKAGMQTTVPLWVALYLRKRNLCRLACPEWMTVPHLQNVLKHERDPHQDSFSTALPFRYAELSHAILSAVGATRSAAHASASGGGGGGMSTEEIPQVEVVRVLLEDIAMVRMDKIRRNLHAMSRETMGASLRRPMPVYDVTGIGAGEMAAVKPFLEGAFEDHLKIIKAGIAKRGRVGNDGTRSGSGDDDDDGGGRGGRGAGARSNRVLRTSRSRNPRRYEENSASVDDTSEMNRLEDDDQGNTGIQADVGDDDSLELPTQANVSKSRIRRYRS